MTAWFKFKATSPEEKPQLTRGDDDVHDRELKKDAANKPSKATEATRLAWDQASRPKPSSNPIAVQSAATAAAHELKARIQADAEGFEAFGEVLVAAAVE